MKELDCEYMVDERTAIVEAQEKNKRECGRSRALVGHNQMGISQDPEVTWTRKSFLAKFQASDQRRHLANTRKTAGPTLTRHYKL
jgi:hypothetical protein